MKNWRERNISHVIPQPSILLTEGSEDNKLKVVHDCSSSSSSTHVTVPGESIHIIGAQRLRKKYGSITVQRERVKIISGWFPCYLSFISDEEEKEERKRVGKKTRWCFVNWRWRLVVLEEKQRKWRAHDRSQLAFSMSFREGQSLELFWFMCVVALDFLLVAEFKLKTIIIGLIVELNLFACSAQFSSL